MFEPSLTRLQIKVGSRHYYLQQAIFDLRRQNFKETDANLKVVERFQKEIEEIEEALLE
jgi:hypothetical protein